MRENYEIASKNIIETSELNVAQFAYFVNKEEKNYHFNYYFTMHDNNNSLEIIFRCQYHGSVYRKQFFIATICANKKI